MSQGVRIGQFTDLLLFLDLCGNVVGGADIACDPTLVVKARRAGHIHVIGLAINVRENSAHTGVTRGRLNRIGHDLGVFFIELDNVEIVAPDQGIAAALKFLEEGALGIDQLALEIGFPEQV